MPPRRRQQYFLVNCPCCDRSASFRTEPSPRSFFETIVWLDWKRLSEAGLHIQEQETLQTCNDCKEPSNGFLIVIDRPQQKAKETLPKCEECRQKWLEENKPKRY